MPKPVADAETQHDTALETMLKLAVRVGAKEPGALVKAKRARQDLRVAFQELRDAERQRGIEGSINWVHSQLGIARHSAIARGPADINVLATVTIALDELSKATW